MMRTLKIYSLGNFHKCSRVLLTTVTQGLGGSPCADLGSPLHTSPPSALLSGPSCLSCPERPTLSPQLIRTLSARIPLGRSAVRILRPGGEQALSQRPLSLFLCPLMASAPEQLLHTVCPV